MGIQWLPEVDQLVELGIITEIFFLFSYGYILFMAANLIGDGSERLLLIYGPGIVGGLVIPILGAIPDGAIILVSGLGNLPKAQLQEQLSVGVGTLAGSTVSLLTLPFMGTILCGSRDLDETGNVLYTSRNKPLVTKWKITSGVRVADDLPTSAIIMMITSSAYLIIQIPAFIYGPLNNAEETQKEHIPALIGFCYSIAMFIGYGVYQLYSANKIASIERKQETLRIDKWKKQVAHTFSNPSKSMRKLVFEKFDRDQSGEIDLLEFQEGLRHLGLNMNRMQLKEFADTFDTNGDGKINYEEFRNFFQTCLLKGNVDLSPTTDDTAASSSIPINDETAPLLSKNTDSYNATGPGTESKQKKFQHQLSST